MTDPKIANGEVEFSVVVAVHDSPDTAQDLYRSLDGQSIQANKIEIILVGGRSAEQSLKLAKNWQSRSLLDVQIIQLHDDGIASKRNAGIERAIGRWISFVDTNDVFHPNYFTELSNFVQRDLLAKAAILSSKTTVYYGDKGHIAGNQRQNWTHRHGDRLIDLNLEPHVVTFTGNSTTLKRDILVENQLRFNSKVGVGFAKLDLIGRYLSHLEKPILGLVADSRIYKRIRSDYKQLDDPAWLSPEKYIQDPKYGHLDMLRYVTRELVHTPVWAQNMVMVSLNWYFVVDRSWRNPITKIDHEVLDEFWVILREIFSFIEASTIRNFSLMNMGWYISEGILRQFKNEAWKESDRKVVYSGTMSNVESQGTKYVYSYVGAVPVEEFIVDGNHVRPIYAKSIRQDLFGHHLMNERIVVLSNHNQIDIRLDGESVEIAGMPKANRLPDFRNDLPGALSPRRETEATHVPDLVKDPKRRSVKAIVRLLELARLMHAKSIEEAWLADESEKIAKFRILLREIILRQSRLATWAARSKNQIFTGAALRESKTEKYRNAWIFIDRKDRADDNAEHLYRYVMNEHPEVNSWFMIERKSEDWSRLSKEGFRLIPYGAHQATSATLVARFIISSHMDDGIYDPIDTSKYGKIEASRIFLQHGLTMNDISKWINTKELAFVVAASPREHETFVRDESYYRLNSGQVKLTGFPRHDSLVQLAARNPLELRDHIMIVPTWRRGLVEQMNQASSASDRRHIFAQSEFYTGWSKLLNSLPFHSWIRENDLSPVLALHDHFADFADMFDVFGPIRVHRFSEMTIQNMLVTSRLLITDYSSLSIDAAVAGASVYYYQFDQDSIYDGNHSFGRSWFSYSEDGVGPVYIDCDSLLGELRNFSSGGSKIPKVFKERLMSLIPLLDGQSSQRVFKELKCLDDQVLEKLR